ncbi:MAG: Phosphorylase kinase alpha subunit [uncultured Thiotrichaceae bacterium]|uniref:Phosphorylase kinase alpha subunit n=1 Tax=uncultured Thiotrichaceae bacterium TaxID=298394 RepID=A0A6S6S495_9GAMM|nr:MAG: Phosphorylase kinase alpha subunit [uncultured Thiotrichaceae bacterium]
MKTNSLRDVLDAHFETINTIILSRQDPVTGLLPASTAINAHGDYTDAWVRDNVYSIMSVWGLALAYRRENPDHNRSYTLSQSVVKLMRGLLTAMMRQADRVETFKNTLNPLDALHAKYGTQTGLAVVGDDEWGHLQLDATSLFLLMMAQMTASGLRIVYTLDEVNFVQNLVHYVSHTFCTPDFGIWERGNKINHGDTEVNCSSVGMAKAALEAMSGFNLFGNVASQQATIHVVPSDIIRSRHTLEGLLPRESNSKETDAALLSVIGYPAYAIEDKALADKTRGKIISKLAGEYGCKRFLLDGHQSVLEDPTRLHYEPSELREFENVESEWPLFFTYLLLDALMREDAEAIQHWQKKLEPLFVEENDQPLLPELYIVPEESIAAEKANPGSQKRVANENVPLVWAQSLHMLSAMILDGTLRPNDIDPLRRRERIGHQRNTTPLVSLLAENDSVKQQLLDMGFKTETPEDVKPVKVMHSNQLSKLHTQLGKNDKLGLSGRPYLATRTITTASMYLLEGQEIVFLPYYYNPRGFYFSYDNKLLVEHFRSSIKVLAKHWDQPGQPMMTFLVQEDMLASNERDVVLELLNEFQRGKCNSVEVRTGPMGQLLTSAAIERIEYLDGYQLDDTLLRGRAHNNKSKQVLEASSASINRELKALKKDSDETLIRKLMEHSVTRLRVHAFGRLWKRQDAQYIFEFDQQNYSISQIAEELYDTASGDKDWAAIRHLADICGKYDDRLEDALLDIVIRQKRLAVGRAYSEKAMLEKPTDNQGIVNTINEFSGKNIAENVLTQEIMLHLGHLIRTEPELFDDLLTLRTWYFVQLLVGQISNEESLPFGESYDFLLGLAPHDVYEKLRDILKAFKSAATKLVYQENLQASEIPSLEKLRNLPNENNFKENAESWTDWRKQAGMVARLPSNFYKDIWYLLRQCNALVIGDKYDVQSRLSTDVTSHTTAGERDFALRIDDLLQSIHSPEYRQLNIEAIVSLAWLFRQSDALHIEDDLVLDVLIGHAVRLTWERQHTDGQYNEHRGQAWEEFYKLSPKEADNAFIEALMYLLTPQHFSEAV